MSDIAVSPEVMAAARQLLAEQARLAEAEQAERLRAAQAAQEAERAELEALAREVAEANEARALEAKKWEGHTHSPSKGNSLVCGECGQTPIETEAEAAERVAQDETRVAEARGEVE